MPGKRTAIVFATVVAAVAAWAFIPAAQGFHIGYNIATDGQCLSRIFDWCKPGQPHVATTPQAAPVDTTPAPVPASQPTPPIQCARGLVPSGGRCVDRRHLPCPSGYTGWQNAQVDNCLEKPS